MEISPFFIFYFSWYSPPIIFFINGDHCLLLFFPFLLLGWLKNCPSKENSCKELGSIELPTLCSLMFLHTCMSVYCLEYTLWNRYVRYYIFETLIFTMPDENFSSDIACIKRLGMKFSSSSPLRVAFFAFIFDV